jgi:hypothetical protein
MNKTHKTHFSRDGHPLKINAPSLEPAPPSESDLGYTTMAFPTLFPDGTGDFYQARLRKVNVGEYFKRLHFAVDGLASTKISVVRIKYTTTSQDTVSVKGLR